MTIGFRSTASTDINFKFPMRIERAAMFRFIPTGTRLYIVEARAAPEATPPIHFQQSLSILDENGDIVRFYLCGLR